MSNKLQMNQFSQTPLKGAVAALLNDLTLSCQVDTASVATLVAGTKVKLTSAVGNTIMIDAAIASDQGIGFVPYTPKKDSWVAGDPVEVVFSFSIIWAEASGAVTRGDSLNSVATGAKVKTSTGDPVCGLALDTAADGDIFRIMVITPLAFSSTMTSGSINGVAIGGSTPAAAAFTTLAASGASTLTGAVTLGSWLQGPTTAQPVLRRKLNVSRANMNTGGQVVVAAVTGKKIRVIDMQIIAIGANAAATANATGVAISATQAAGAVKLLVSVLAALTRSAVNRPGITNNTVLADGASFATNDVSTGITVGADGGTDLITVTSFDVEVSYVLET